MLTEAIADTRAWTAATIDERRSWTTTLTDAYLDELVARSSEPTYTTEIRLRPDDLPLCRSAMAGVLEALNRGRGFALVDGLLLEDEAQAQRIYWLLGQTLGDPFAQDVNGPLLFAVRDTGRDVTEGARFSVTNAESSFHTDGAFNPAVPDYVGLLCLKTARSGGRSQLGQCMHCPQPDPCGGSGGTESVVRDFLLRSPQ